MRPSLTAACLAVVAAVTLATVSWAYPAGLRTALHGDGIASDRTSDGARGAAATGGVHDRRWAVPRRGVAVAGGSFNDGMLVGGRAPMTNATPGRYGHDWFYDVDGGERTDDGGLEFLAARGHDLIRVDFRWERLQPTLGGPLDLAEADRIEAMLDAADRTGLQVVLDCHNYGHYKTADAPGTASAQGGWAIGDVRLPPSAFADLWRRIVARWGDHPAVWGWELMNEPVDMGPQGVERWQRASQAAVDAIRAAEPDGDARAVLVAGYDWSKVQNWSAVNGDPWIDDPLGDPRRLLYTAHHYWDGDADSVYGDESPTELSGSTSAHADRVVAELREFTDWLRRHRVRGAVTEVGWPDNASVREWNQVAGHWFREADDAGLHVTTWATGAAWGDYELAVYAVADGDSWHEGGVVGRATPQAAVVERFAHVDPRTIAH